MTTEKPAVRAQHHVILEERGNLIVSGVEDVESFDENGVTMQTVRGVLVVRGSGLHIDRLSIDKGELNIQGGIDSLEYSEERERGGFWSRLLK